MKNSIICISILTIVGLIFFSAAFTVADVIVPSTAGVVKPPDISVPSTLPSPSLVTPVGPVSPITDSPVRQQSPGIVQSPVMGTGPASSEPETQADKNATAITGKQPDYPYVPDRVIVKFSDAGLKGGRTMAQIQTEAHGALGASVLVDSAALGMEGVQVVSVPNNTGTMKAIALYEMNPAVQYAEPDYIYTINSTAFKPPVVVNPDPVAYRGQIPTMIRGSAPDVVQQKGSDEPCKTCSDKEVGISGSLSSEPILSADRYAAAQAEVDAINAYIQENNLSWTAGVNDIMLMTPEEREALKGLRHDVIIPELMDVEDEPISVISNLPTSFTWRNNGGDWTTPIRNQGSCGSCWAFATTGVYESYMERKTGNPSLNPNYAEEYLVQCASDQYGCGGGYFTSMAYFVDKAGSSGGVGTVTEASYPYTAKDGTCKSLSGYTRYKVDTGAGERWRYVGSGEWSIPSVDAIKTAIYQYGPIVAGVYAESSFDSYRSGILDSTASSSYTNHAIIIVGWGESNGRTYWICKNSWGTSWGESGWFRIYAGRLRIGEGAAYFQYSTTTQTGSIAVSSSPSGARIWLDGTDTTRTTPATLSDVAAGTRTVTLKMNGYNDYSSSVSVSSGNTVTVSGSLSPASSDPTMPNDPFFGSLWGLHNTGQSGGTIDADIDAPEAWATTMGSPSVIIAVVDTGVDTTHPDLAANMVGGYNAINGTTNQIDDHGHGTHCAGTIGAIGNNGIGVIGVAPNTKIMPLKFLGSNGGGSTTDAISAITWGYNNGARIFSNSWGGGGHSQALLDKINQYSDALFICAAGNNGRDTDQYPNYPSAYTSPNIIAVAATDRWDNLASFSNYGRNTVDVGAPGVSILSTLPGNGYASWGGTSMATPHVAGVAALMKAANPTMSVAEIKSAIMSGVDVKGSLSGKCVTGGRLNAYQAVARVSTLLAKFYGVPGVEVLPLTIRFYDVSEGRVSSRLWNFGDGTTNTTQNPVKVYATPGSYTVQLTVSDGLSSSSTETAMISGFMD